MIQLPPWLCVLLAGIQTLQTARAEELRLFPLGDYDTLDGGAEIIVYDAGTRLLLSTYSGDDDGHGVEVLDASDPSGLTRVRRVDLSGLFDGAIDSVTSVAVDPLGRGFGAATVAPADPDYATRGVVAFFDFRDGTLLGTVEVGYLPDSVSFAPDGSALFVANEGERPFLAVDDPRNPYAIDQPGSLSVVDLSGVDNTGARLANFVPQGAVADYDFSPGNLANPADLGAARLGPGVAGSPGAWFDLEPEYASYADGRVYVGLQENNAVAVFDLALQQWAHIESLGTREFVIDSTFLDGPDGGPAIQRDDLVEMLPQPDSIRAFTVNGTTYLVTANEGALRADDAARPVNGGLNIDPAYFAELQARYPDGHPFDGDNLGALVVSTTDGDSDGDGDIDSLTAFGSRGITIYDTGTWEIAYDSGVFFEEWVAENDPRTFNMDLLPTRWDERSDNSGAEPESLTIGELGDDLLLFVGMQRQNGVFMFNINDPENPVLLDYINLVDDFHIAPESLEFLTADESPTGVAMLLASYEATESIVAFEIREAIPEPGVGVLFLLGGLPGLLRRWRS